MKKYLFLSILAIWSSQVFSGVTTTVRLNPDYDLVVTATTNTTFELGSAKASGDATADSAPARVYIPMDGPAAIDEAQYFTVPGVTELFSPTSVRTVNFPLYLNTVASDYFLYMAIKEPAGSYKIVKKHPTTFNNATNVNESFPVSTQEMCVQVGDCTNFPTVSGTEKTYLSYFFFSTSSTLPTGLVVVPATETGGIFFEINMSNRIYTSAAITPVISEIRAGDRRVTIKYSSNTSILKPKSVRVYNQGGSPAVVSNQPVKSYAGALTAKEYDYVNTGEITLTDTVNGVVTYYSVLFVDLYKFGTVLSVDLEGTSKSIEELLKANQCFLLTAGFGEEHFIINYFRHFRDTVLMNSFLGREFVHFYYELAPKYALLLYQNETLRALVRAAAYVAYFVFNYYLLILAGALISGSGIYLYKKREKIKI